MLLRNGCQSPAWGQNTILRWNNGHMLTLLASPAEWSIAPHASILSVRRWSWPSMTCRRSHALIRISALDRLGLEESSCRRCGRIFIEVTMSRCWGISLQNVLSRACARCDMATDRTSADEEFWTAVK